MEGGESTRRDDKPRRRARGEVFIDVERCKGCAFCVEFCPSHVLIMAKTYNAKGYHPPEVANPDVCSGCDLCGMYCPDFAIYGVRIRAEGGAGEPA